MDVALEDSLDLLNPPSRAASGYLTCDSHANSDYDDTDGEAGAYTDGEAEDAYDQPALARSSEPAQTYPSHGLSEQVGTPNLQQGLVGRGAQNPPMGVNSYLTVVLAGEGLSPPALQGPWCLGTFSCGETQPSPVLGTNHAWPPLMPVSFYTGDRAAPAGTVAAAQQHQVPRTPRGGSVPALHSLVLHGGDRLC